MAKAIKDRSVKSGLPPGTLVHIGEQSDREISITVMEYGDAGCEERTITSLKECFYFADPQRVCWINVEGLHEVEMIQQLGDCQGLHPLVLEDIVNTEQRPKLDDYGDYLYIVGGHARHRPRHARLFQAQAVAVGNFGPGRRGRTAWYT
jgi:magnesium transporter